MDKSTLKKILIIGNGFGGIYVLKNLHKLLHKKISTEITLIGKENYFLFTPLLHEVATGGVSPENIIQPIHSILPCHLDSFYAGQAEVVNLKDNTVKVGDTVLSYDYLILSIGSETNFYNIKGAEEFSLKLKSLSDAILLKNRIISIMEKASEISDQKERKKMLHFVVVGGGATGVELASELQEFIKETFSYYYKKEIIDDVVITLVHALPELLSNLPPDSRIKSLEVLKEKGVEVLLNTKVLEVSESIVSTSNGEIHSQNVIWVAGVKPMEIKFDQEIDKTAGGQIITNEFLQLSQHRNVFVMGDVGLIKKGESTVYAPMLAQVAVEEAKVVSSNITAMMSGKDLKEFTYQSLGNLVSLGRWKALGQVSNLFIYGGFAWWIWRTVYLFKLISWKKRFMVAIDWTLGILSPRDISKI